MRKTWALLQRAPTPGKSSKNLREIGKQLCREPGQWYRWSSYRPASFSLDVPNFWVSLCLCHLSKLVLLKDPYGCCKRGKEAKARAKYREGYSPVSRRKLIGFSFTMRTTQGSWLLADPMCHWSLESPGPLQSHVEDPMGNGWPWGSWPSRIVKSPWSYCQEGHSPGSPFWPSLTERVHCFHRENTQEASRSLTATRSTYLFLSSCSAMQSPPDLCGKDHDVYL